MNARTVESQTFDRIARDSQSASPRFHRIDDPYGAEAHFERLRQTIAPLRHTLLHHPIYAAVDSIERLREFMRIHVFAVWDFMSLVKRLRNEVTYQALPWLPPVSAQIARFANELVLGEESDLGPDNKPASHFELYLRAMNEIGADTATITRFVGNIRRGIHWTAALKELEIPNEVDSFVNETLHCAIHGSAVEVASYFFFGREDIIPDMFKNLLPLLGRGTAEVPHLAYYLKRHIELDGDNHGPWAREMLISLARRNATGWKEATRAAQHAITARIRLWDGVQARLGSL